MKLKTIKHKQVCPYCGCKEVAKIIHYDGRVTGTNVVCANCGAAYALSKTYDEESDYGQLIKLTNSWSKTAELKAEIEKCLEEDN